MPYENEYEPEPYEHGDEWEPDESPGVEWPEKWDAGVNPADMSHEQAAAFLAQTQNAVNNSGGNASVKVKLNRNSTRVSIKNLGVPGEVGQPSTDELNEGLDKTIHALKRLNPQLDSLHQIAKAGTAEFKDMSDALSDITKSAKDVESGRSRHWDYRLDPENPEHVAYKDKSMLAYTMSKELAQRLKDTGDIFMDIKIQAALDEMNVVEGSDAWRAAQRIVAGGRGGGGAPADAKYTTTWVKGIRDQAMDQLGNTIQLHLDQMGAANWQLVNMVSLSKDGVIRSGQGSTTDLMFIWKQ